MDEQKIKDAVIDAMATAMEAQARALRRLRHGRDEVRPRRRTGRSQVDLAEDVLRAAGVPLHVREIIDRIEKNGGVRVDRESIVSALTKKVMRGDRFVRSAPNTFALKEDGS